MKNITGYARVVTDVDGKIIYTHEMYNFDPQMDVYLNEVNFDDWIDSLGKEYSDCEVLVTYTYWSDKYNTQEGYEYEDGLDIVEAFVTCKNHEETLRNIIKSLRRLHSGESMPPEFCGDESDLHHYEGIYFEIYENDIE